jgi:uncharacterized protein (DUF433 family)
MWGEEMVNADLAAPNPPWERSGWTTVKAETVTMIPSTPIEILPLETDVDGAVRVGNTRVTLDTIVMAFAQGATAEEIAQQYSSLQLADIYAVIAYYLRHRSAVEAYLGHRVQQAELVRSDNETRFDPSGVRDRLLARRARQQR